MPITRILVPTDFSPYADYAMRYAAALARALGAEVFILHVVPERDLHAMYDYPPGFPLEQILADQKRVAEQHFATMAGEEGLGDIRLTPLVFFGKPAEEIVKVAQDFGIDLIVIASHGRTGIPRVLLGSVAERVLRHAPCPVLVIKHPELVRDAAHENRVHAQQHSG